jgi:hypothetical protein
MVDHQVAGIKTYLTNMSLHASPEWLEGCVEFFVSEHHNQQVSLKLCSTVFKMKLLLTFNWIKC